MRKRIIGSRPEAPACAGEGWLDLAHLARVEVSLPRHKAVANERQALVHLGRVEGGR